MSATEIVESDDTYGERHAYLGTQCSDLLDGFADLEEWETTQVIHSLFTDINSALLRELQIGLAEYEAIWVPPWSREVKNARIAIIAHEQAWIDLLEDELELALRISNEGSLEKRQDMVRDLLDLNALADPAISSTWETVSRRYKEAASSAEDLTRIELIINASTPDCSRYEPVLERWR